MKDIGVIIGSHSLWNMDPSLSGSWLPKSICKVRAMARKYIVCSRPATSVCSDNSVSLFQFFGYFGNQKLYRTNRLIISVRFG